MFSLMDILTGERGGLNLPYLLTQEYLVLLVFLPFTGVCQFVAS